MRSLPAKYVAHGALVVKELLRLFQLTWCVSVQLYTLKPFWSRTSCFRFVLLSFSQIVEALGHLSSRSCPCPSREQERETRHVVNGLPHQAEHSLSFIGVPDNAEEERPGQERNGSADARNSPISVYRNEAKDARSVSVSLLQFLSNLCVKNRRTRIFVRQKLCFHRLLLLALTAPSIDPAFMLLSTLFQEDAGEAGDSGEQPATQKSTHSGKLSVSANAAVEHSRGSMGSPAEGTGERGFFLSDGHAGKECAEQAASVFSTTLACSDPHTTSTPSSDPAWMNLDQLRFFDSLTVLYAMAAQQANCTASFCCEEEGKHSGTGQAFGKTTCIDAGPKCGDGPPGVAAQTARVTTKQEGKERLGWASSKSNGGTRVAEQVPGGSCPEWPVLFFLRMFQKEPEERWFYRFFEHIQTRVSADTFEQCAILLLTPPTDAEEEAAEEITSVVLADHGCRSENEGGAVRECTIFETVESIAAQSCKTPADIRAYCERPCRAAYIQRLLRHKLSHTGRSTLLHFLLAILEAVLDENIVTPAGGVGRPLTGMCELREGGRCGRRAKLKEVSTFPQKRGGTPRPSLKWLAALFEHPYEAGDGRVEHPRLRDVFWFLQ